MTAHEIPAESPNLDVMDGLLSGNLSAFAPENEQRVLDTLAASVKTFMAAELPPVDASLEERAAMYSKGGILLDESHLEGYKKLLGRLDCTYFKKADESEHLGILWRDAGAYGESHLNLTVRNGQVESCFTRNPKTGNMDKKPSLLSVAQVAKVCFAPTREFIDSRSGQTLLHDKDNYNLVRPAPRSRIKRFGQALLGQGR